MDGAVETIAGAQGGVISVRQLHAAGVSSTSIARRVARGRLYRLARGVYALTPVVGVEGRRWAALLAAGIDRASTPPPVRRAPNARRNGERPPACATEDAAPWPLRHPPRPDGTVVLSHWSALQVAGIVRVEPAVHDATVVGPGRRATRNPGVRGHVVACLAPEDRIWHGRMPCVAPTRALVDVADAVTPARLRSLIREAQFLGQLDARSIDSLRRRIPTHPGLAAMRRADPDLLADGTSPLEILVGTFLERETGLAPWSSQHPLHTSAGSYRFDFARPDLRLAVEADGGGAHVTTQGRAADAARDAEASAAGWETVRVMRTHVTGRAARRRTAERIERIAARRGWSGGGSARSGRHVERTD
ncbi:type IV toxin-antitoxin system AbiEi family antitoxin domain-containing protein [Patulibacter brassicae]|uniref:Type IV toxin-antitoxin system AbiEi family antitoxin domain-containing protein n=1 Tax=Patulibacter brassicae TaxID=1705717 RepID=A0ABU4VFI3_9ACTN|nr:type IV toxin-antitoxin system AbiEi family antitoxin domain-containing protein [Patulibacter brassicae]MDX8150582.1 type IV toxin-antitoxin system AbiEi family antitoxin domain-containing protein [Patulibacter brassicae]